LFGERSVLESGRAGVVEEDVESAVLNPFEAKKRFSCGFDGVEVHQSMWMKCRHPLSWLVPSLVLYESLMRAMASSAFFCDRVSM